MNKKLNPIMDYIGIAIALICIFSFFEKIFEIKFFTAHKLVAFYYWIAMFYYGIVYCYLSYQASIFGSDELDKKSKRYQIFSMVCMIVLFILNIIKF